MSRVDNQFQRLSGCVFWRTPGETTYIRVTLHDKTTPGLNAVVLEGKASTRRDPQFPRPTRTLHVAPDGKGDAFTRAQPGELKNGMARVRQGERLLLQTGRYHVGDLKLTNSGTADLPIQIVGEGQVVIDGAQTKPLLWRAAGPTKGLFVTDTEAVNPNLVLANGKRLYPHQSLADLTDHKITVGLDLKGRVRFPANLDGFYRNPSGNPLINRNWRSRNRLYVKFRDNSDPNKKRMVVTRRNRGLTLHRNSNVRLRNLRFSNYGLAPAGAALLLRDCRDIAIDGCTFGVNDIGISLAGDCSRITIQGSEFFDAMQGYFAWKMKATYDLYSPYSNIFPYLSRMLERGGLIYSHGFRGRGIVVRHCRFHDFAQAGHLGPASFNNQFKDSFEIDFHDNEVFRCAEDGFELDGDARNVRIWGNTFHHCNAPLSLAVARSGPTYIFRNVFHSITADTFTIVPADGLKTQPGHAFKFSTGDIKNRIGDLFLIHNTIHGGNTAVGFHLTQPARWKRFFARNNAVVASRNYAIQVASQKPLPTDLDHNAYWRFEDADVGWVDQNLSGGKPPQVVTQIKQLRELGWERSGLFASPGFRDSVKHDYRLRPDSPLINAGQLIPGVNDTHSPDMRPDIGAFENPAKPTRRGD